jgi:hypothetical protein
VFIRDNIYFSQLLGAVNYLPYFFFWGVRGLGWSMYRKPSALDNLWCGLKHVDFVDIGNGLYIGSLGLQPFASYLNKGRVSDSCLRK